MEIPNRIHTLPFGKKTGYILHDPYRDVENLAALLDTSCSGMETYHKVCDGLQAKYGDNFKSLLLAEVGR